ECDDRNCVGGDHVRHQRIPERPPARKDERGDDRGSTPENEAAERLLEGDPCAAKQLVALVDERLHHVGEPRQQEFFHPENIRKQPLPRGDAEAEDHDRREPVADLLADASGRRRCRRDRTHALSSAAESVSSTSSAPTAWSDSRTWVTSSKNRGCSRDPAVRG